MLKVDREKCKRDGICAAVCPIGILGMDEKEGPFLRPGSEPFCIACGHCVAVCPHGALDHARSPLERQEDLPKLPILDAPTASLFLRSRRSIRCYQPDPVPGETTLQLLDIARYAPSGHNSQGISYIVVEDPALLRRIRELVIEWMMEMTRTQPELSNQFQMPGIIKSHERGEDRILRGAPLVIVATAPRTLRPAPVSTYLALEYVELYATTLGLGTCWAGFAYICAQQYPPLAQYLKVPRERTVTGMMMVGYPRYRYYRLPERNPLDVRWLTAEDVS